MQRIDDPGTRYEQFTLYIVEVYYNDEDNSIIGWTEKETVYGETIDEVRQTLHWMLDALDKPLLIESELLAQTDENFHEVGIQEYEIIDYIDFSHDSPAEDEDLLDNLLSSWEDDGGNLGPG